jgi:serine/threonine protein kinase
VHPDLAHDAPTVKLRRLGRYVLREHIGEGGMGVVYKAVDPDGRVVAVKLLRPHVAGDAESRARFAREAQALARVRGEHVAQVLDADVAAATPYLVTDFVDGPSLQETVARDGPLTGADLADLAGDLADALCSIHGAGVVHRDLKPGNVLIQNGLAIVIDFGIAQIADDTRLTMPGTVYGTPGYVAPELLNGGDVTPAADIHSWAATVTYAATGRPPFGQGPLEAVAYRVLQEEPDLAGCPEWLIPVLRRCFAKDPTARPSAHELLHWLETGEPPPERTATVTADDHPTVAIPARLRLPSQPTVPVGADGSELPDRSEVSAADAATAVYGNDHSPGGYPDRVAYPDRIASIAEPAVEATRIDADVVHADHLDANHLDAGPADASAYDSPADAGPLDETALDRPVTSTWGRSHQAVLLLAFVTLAALAAVVPAVAAIGLVAWLVLARTVDRSARLVRRRRFTRGRRRTDLLAAAVALPWHVVRGVLVTALTLPFAVAGAGVLLGLVILFFYAGVLTPRLDVVLGAIALTTAVLAWWGLDGDGVRRGSRHILAGLLTPRWAPATAAGVLVVLTLLALTAANVEPVWWWPLEVSWSWFGWPG